MSEMLLTSRRSFLKALGVTAGGLALGIWKGEAIAVAADKGTEISGFRPNAFIQVAVDGTVTILCARSEMGQGVRSTLPALLADEMGADLKHIKVVQADGDEIYGDQNTDGSSSVRKPYQDLRRLGATARLLLVTAAARKWQVSADTCDARDSFVIHIPSKRKLAFKELVLDASALPVPKAAEVKLRADKDMKHVFRDLPLIDSRDIVTGKAVFGADVKLPGMLYAMIARSPVIGGKIAEFDKKAALAVPGVKKVIELSYASAPYGFQPLGGVAVIADNTWAAMRGRAALKATWKGGGDNAEYDSEKYKEALLQTVRKPGKTVRKVGDIGEAFKKAARRVEAEYYAPHLAHATMEPLVALANYANGKCECWAPTQNPQASRKQVAESLGLDESKVTVHVTLLGGGFGRKSKPDYVAEAALLSKEMGAPVRVQWTRDDDIKHDYFHTVSAQRLEASLDEKGQVTGWLHRTAFPTISSTFANDMTHPMDGELQQGVTDVPLAFPNVQAESGEAIAHTRIGWLRSVCNIQHAFAVSSFLDEIAHARKMDPAAFLREAYGKPRLVTLKELGVEKMPNYDEPLSEHPIDVGRFHGVLDRVLALSNWKNRRGRHLGLAVHRSFVTYVAVVVSVKKDGEGKLHVDEAWMVKDAGTVLNTERARSQMEGAINFALSHALYGAITMKAGAVEQSNFHDFRVARLNETPRKIHVELVKSTRPPGGIGEPGVPPVAPAIANAVFAATGKRVRTLPLVQSGLFA